MIDKEQIRNAALEEAIKAIESAERLVPQESYMPLTEEDKVHNRAIDCAILAIRSLATTSTEPAAPTYENAPVACAENGVLRWMTGRKFQNCELYTRPASTEPAKEAAKAPLAYAIYGISAGKHYIRDVKLIPADDTSGAWKSDDDGLGDYWAGNTALVPVVD